MNRDLRKLAKITLKNIFLKLMNDAVFGKIMENLKKTQKYLTCQNSEKKLLGVRTKLLNYKVFHRNSISNGNENTQILMNKPVYLGISIRLKKNINV